MRIIYILKQSLKRALTVVSNLIYYCRAKIVGEKYVPGVCTQGNVKSVNTAITMELNLKNLKLSSGVTRTDETDPIIQALDPYFEGCSSYITSILRTPEHQLEIIEDFAKDKGLLLKEEKLNFTDKVFYLGREVLKWQLIWSQVYSKGIIVNPPQDAEIICDCFVHGENIKGVVINASEHFKGTAFDIGGRMQDGTKNPELKYSLVVKAKNDGVKIRKLVLEHQNDAVHVAVLI